MAATVAGLGQRSARRASAMLSHHLGPHKPILGDIVVSTSAARAVLLQNSHGLCWVRLAFYTKDKEQGDSTGFSPFLLPRVQENSVEDNAELLGKYF